ncbi:MAG: hypothetical protein HOE45_12200 [Gammaproteobacteria bacterium]|nr:hypothetical protein [Gammaproteobacteria bacterium]MBT4147609.1 hypothetical protein [Gammaproteobacteria bacterium]MBT5222275.1 hypothetical protein [Gammaproteobacteria bacterium]MBT5967388.1 hypothetical protein [Gammaproteobacteria bacterium]
MQSTSLTGSLINSGDQPRNKPVIFITFLLLATALPFIAGPILRSVYSGSDVAQQLFYLLLMAGGYHQVASVYLYFDDDAKKIINQHTWYFYFWPLMIASSIMLFYLLDNLSLESYLLQIYAMLTIYHYQKQNIGVYSLLAPSVGFGRMLPIERGLIMGGALVGMLVFTWPIDRSLFQGTVLSTYKDSFEAASLILLCALTLYTSYFACKNYLFIAAAQRQYLRAALLLSLVTFFWPMFIVQDKQTAFFMYATAHGLQYYVFIAIASVNGDKIQKLLQTEHVKGVLFRHFNLILFIALTALSAYIWKQLYLINPPPIFNFSDTEIKRAIFGLASSISLIHYWIDGRIWKIRHDDSRIFMRSKFQFLFAK